jgi:dynein heavy chain
MRDMVKNNGNYNETQSGKWIILDGDIDPEWIESLNTVMDDNKVLTLVSQERIPLTPAMRLLLEISNLKNATPATVSRGGVLFINDSDVGWKPYLESWMDQFKKRNDEYARNVFYLAISHYLNEGFIEDMKNKETICPMVEISYIMTLTTIVDALYQDFFSKKEYTEHLKQLKEAGNEEAIKNIYEAFFIFAIMWSFGASLTEDKISFNNVLKHSAKVKFPDVGQCYDYYFHPIEGQWVPWTNVVKSFEPGYDQMFQNIIVQTAETTRQKYILNLHIKRRKAVLYVGSAGTGKTTIIKDYFTEINKETTITAAINFNSFTDSKALQAVMEANVDKRSGKLYGPPPNHVLIFFMDDLNMPMLDKYGTQSPICLIRQVIDYQVMYDRDHLEEKKYLADCLFTACMNPKSGSFNIDLRLQRHYSVFSCLNPEKEILQTIFLQILQAHLN